MEIWLVFDASNVFNLYRIGIIGRCLHVRPRVRKQEYKRIQGCKDASRWGSCNWSDRSPKAGAFCHCSAWPSCLLLAWNNETTAWSWESFSERSRTTEILTLYTIQLTMCSILVCKSPSATETIFWSEFLPRAASTFSAMYWLCRRKPVSPCLRKAYLHWGTLRWQTCSFPIPWDSSWFVFDHVSSPWFLPKDVACISSIESLQACLNRKCQTSSWGQASWTEVPSKTWYF